jgi:hypothetical protein
MPTDRRSVNRAPVYWKQWPILLLEADLLQQDSGQ